MAPVVPVVSAAVQDHGRTAAPIVGWHHPISAVAAVAAPVMVRWSWHNNGRRGVRHGR